MMLHSRLRFRLGVALGLLLACCSLKAATSEVYQTIDLSQLSSSRVCAGSTASNVPSAYGGRGPIHAFDGSGLTGDAHVATVANIWCDALLNTMADPQEGVLIEAAAGAINRACVVETEITSDADGHVKIEFDKGDRKGSEKHRDPRVCGLEVLPL